MKSSQSLYGVASSTRLPRTPAAERRNNGATARSMRPARVVSQVVSQLQAASQASETSQAHIDESFMTAVKTAAMSPDSNSPARLHRKRSPGWPVLSKNGLMGFEASDR